MRLEEDVEEVEVHEDDEEEENEAEKGAVVNRGDEDVMEEIEEVETDEKGWLDWWASETSGTADATSAGMHHLFLSPVPMQVKPKGSRSRRSTKSTAGSSGSAGGPSRSGTGSQQSSRGGEGSSGASNVPDPSTQASTSHHVLFSCPRCEKTYQLRSSLNRHLRWECGKEPRFQCVLCSYRSKHKSHVVRHVKFAH